jgi:hypothetical protein
MDEVFWGGDQGLMDDLKTVEITIRLADQKVGSRALLREEDVENQDYLSYALRKLISESWDELARKGYLNARS